MVGEIPNKEIKIGKGKAAFNVTIKKWLTQEEEDQYLTILAGDMSVKFDENTTEDDVDTTANMKSVYEAQQYLLRKYLLTPTYEEFNVMQPRKRRKIVNAVMAHHNKKK